ncbi:hypothetical protein DFAR_2810013 [Desulfarculales bacterium]
MNEQSQPGLRDRCMKRKAYDKLIKYVVQYYSLYRLPALRQERLRPSPHPLGRRLFRPHGVVFLPALAERGRSGLHA